MTNSSECDIIIKFAEKRQESQGKTKKLKKVLKKYLTNRKRQDIMKSQTKKNNSSKILEINLTRNLKKEVQSNGIVIKI